MTWYLTSILCSQLIDNVTQPFFLHHTLFSILCKINLTKNFYDVHVYVFLCGFAIRVISSALEWPLTLQGMDYPDPTRGQHSGTATFVSFSGFTRAMLVAVPPHHHVAEVLIDCCKAVDEFGWVNCVPFMLSEYSSSPINSTGMHPVSPPSLTHTIQSELSLTKAGSLCGSAKGPRRSPIQM